MKKILIICLSLLLFLSSYQPSNAASIVDTTKTYTYEMLTEDIKQLQQKYPELVSYHSIGKTFFGRDIWAIKIGKGDSVAFINGSHHAREWISSTLNMRMMERYLESYSENSTLGIYSTRDLLNETSIWFVPMLNPDGVTLQQKGLSAFPKKYHTGLVYMNANSTNFKRWKANARGIDLNRQYPANWYSPTDVHRPYWWNYKGAKPFQAEESIAIRDFTYKIKPEIAVSYHTSGRILYWYFHNKHYQRDYALAKELGSKTGYRLVKPEPNPSGKGYTDWFIQEFDKPAFTPELSYSVGNTNVPLSVFPEIWKRNYDVGLWAVDSGYDLQKKNAVDFNETVMINETNNIYSSLSFGSKESTKFKRANVQALKKFQNWYQVKTSLGNKWVLLPDKLEHFPERSFTDVEKNHWAKAEIDFVNENKWMLGTSKETFNPTGNLTRDQMAVILVRIIGIPLERPAEPTFPDVSGDHWAYPYIETAVKHELFGGYGNGHFGPDDEISREQMAVVLARLTKQPLPEVTAQPFGDVELGQWSSQHIQLLKDLKIFNGRSDGNFGTLDLTTRAEAAVLFKRIETSHPEFFDQFIK